MTVDLEHLQRPFPREAVKQRKGGGGRMYDYIPTHLVIHRLNDATGHNWDWRIVNLERHGDLLMCYGELTIPGHGTRTGIGVQQVSPGGGEDLAKGVSSDALKKAATLFGVALELYGPDVEGDGEIEPAAPVRHVFPSQMGHPEAPTPREALTSQPNPNEPTDKQFNAIYAITGKLEWTKEDARAVLLQRYGVTSSRELSRAQASDLIDYLKKLEADQKAAMREALT